MQYNNNYVVQFPKCPILNNFKQLQIYFYNEIFFTLNLEYAILNKYKIVQHNCYYIAQ